MRRLVVAERINPGGTGTSRWCQRWHAWHRSLLAGGDPAQYVDRCMNCGCRALRTRANRDRLGRIGLKTAEAIDVMPPAEQWEPWPRREAEATMALMLPELLDRYDALFLCGARLRDAVGLRHAATFDHWEPLPGKYVVLIPHPSGLSRAWNDAAAIEAGRRAIRSLA